MARQGGKDNKAFNLGQIGPQSALGHLAKMLSAPVAGSTALQITAFEHTVAAESTTNKTFTNEHPVGGNADTQVWGGYVEVSGATGGAFEIDIGHSGDTDVYVDGITGNGLYGLLIADFQATAEDLIITVTSNASTQPIKVEIAFLACLPVTS